MAIIENLSIDKHKTLLNNKHKNINLIFNDPKKYLDEELFEELCNNDELVDGIDIEVTENLNFKNLEID